MASIIQERYEMVLARINRSAQSVGRLADDVCLVVVTKGQPLERVQAVIQSGARHLGENYAEEGVEKLEALSGPLGVTWHMIGHVQSRKARLVSNHYDWVHSLDSLKLAEKLNRFAAESGRRLSILLECNVSGEESKYGFPAWEDERWEDLAEAVTPILHFSNLDMRGLMTMAPYAVEPEAARPYFRRLRLLRDFLSLKFPGADWSQLSMGMSGDFETAVQEGATIVRVGEAILGSRPG